MCACADLITDYFPNLHAVPKFAAQVNDRSFLNNDDPW
jgi:hypothetical protein